MYNKWSTKLIECVLVQHIQRMTECPDIIRKFWQIFELSGVWGVTWRCHIVGWIKETKFYMTEVRVHVGLDQKRVWKKHRIFPLSSGALIFSFFHLIWCKYSKIWMWTWIILDLGNENSQSFSHFDIAFKMFFFFFNR